MAHHKSAVKAHRKSVIQSIRNKSIKSRVKTFSDKFKALAATGDFSGASISLSQAESEIMKAVRKGVLKLTTASRKVSILTKALKAIDPSTPR